MKSLHLTALFVVASAMLAGSASAGSTIIVTLRDNGQTLDLSTNMGFAMGAHGDMKKAPMSIKINVNRVKSGQVTFKVLNASKETIHEMVLSPIKDENATLPFIEKENRVDEEGSGHLGEVSELDPGKKGELTVDMKPGSYILYCNIPGHYGAGMWTTLKVQ
jgi:uncharacterized cupredoxin-like copper-binding protein